VADPDGKLARYALEHGLEWSVLSNATVPADLRREAAARTLTGGGTSEAVPGPNADLAGRLPALRDSAEHLTLVAACPTTIVSSSNCYRTRTCPSGR
jgi:hypothetical protein